MIEYLGNVWYLWTVTGPRQRVVDGLNQARSFPCDNRPATAAKAVFEVVSGLATWLICPVYRAADSRLMATLKKVNQD